jgi:hypothetical protein
MFFKLRTRLAVRDLYIHQKIGATFGETTVPGPVMNFDVWAAFVIRLVIFGFCLSGDTACSVA